jgi:hypothetical protein
MTKTVAKKASPPSRPHSHRQPPTTTAADNDAEPGNNRSRTETAAPPSPRTAVCFWLTTNHYRNYWGIMSGVLMDPYFSFSPHHQHYLHKHPRYATNEIRIRIYTSKNNANYLIRKKIIIIKA